MEPKCGGCGHEWPDKAAFLHDHPGLTEQMLDRGDLGTIVRCLYCPKTVLSKTHATDESLERDIG